MVDLSTYLRSYGGHILQAGLMIGVIYFLGTTLLRTWSSLTTYQITVSPAHLSLAVAAILLSYLIIWLRWHLTLQFLKSTVSFRLSGELFAFFQLSTYIPGGIWQLINLNYLAQRRNLSKKTVTISMVQHQLVGITAATIVFTMFGGISFLPFSYRYFFVAAVILGGAVVSYPRIMQLLFNALLALAGRDRFEVDTKYWQNLALLGIGVVSWSLTTVGFYLLVHAITGALFSWTLLAVLPGAWLVGFAVLLSPGGLGVREAALIYLLNHSLLQTESVIVSVASRLWLILPELVLGGLFAALALIEHRQILKSAQDRSNHADR